MTTATTPDSTAEMQQVSFLIIGAGFSGLGAAIKLQQAGHTDMIIAPIARRSPRWPRSASRIPETCQSGRCSSG